MKKHSEFICFPVEEYVEKTGETTQLGISEKHMLRFLKSRRHRAVACVCSPGGTGGHSGEGRFWRAFLFNTWLANTVAVEKPEFVKKTVQKERPIIWKAIVVLQVQYNDHQVVRVPVEMHRATSYPDNSQDDGCYSDSAMCVLRCSEKFG